MIAEDWSFATRLLGSLSAGVVAIDDQGHVAYVNARGCHILGLREVPERLSGVLAAEVLGDHPGLLRVLQGVLEGGPAPSRAELALGVGSAAARSIGFSASSVRGEDGEILGASMIFRDLAPFRGPASESGGVPRYHEAIMGESPAIRSALSLARRVAPTRSTVLITGETGTGKELVAGLIHEASTRSERALVKVNCAALPDPLLESELFGHERGAFTGANERRTGRFEEASGGTLFLDEVAEMSPATQAKLLRVLQDQEFHRLGGTRTLRTDARIVSATNTDLEARVEARTFRNDLLYRLDVIRIHLPPLRERPEDVKILCHAFLEAFALDLDRSFRGFTASALKLLEDARWPGNVRELRNVIERAVLLADGNRIDDRDLVGLGERRPGSLGTAASSKMEGAKLEDLERYAVIDALDRAGYVQKGAAELLGISRRKLNYMIRRMGIKHPSWRRNREP